MEMIEIPRHRVQFWRCHNKPTQRDTDTGESLGTPSQKELGNLKIIKNMTFVRVDPVKYPLDRTHRSWKTA